MNFVRLLVFERAVEPKEEQPRKWFQLSGGLHVRYAVTVKEHLGVPSLSVALSNICNKWQITPALKQISRWGRELAMYFNKLLSYMTRFNRILWPHWRGPLACVCLCVTVRNQFMIRWRSILSCLVYRSTVFPLLLRRRFFSFFHRVLQLYKRDDINGMLFDWFFMLVYVVPFLLSKVNFDRHQPYSQVKKENVTRTTHTVYMCTVALFPRICYRVRLLLLVGVFACCVLAHTNWLNRPRFDVPFRTIYEYRCQSDDGVKPNIADSYCVNSHNIHSSVLCVAFR